MMTKRIGFLLAFVACLWWVAEVSNAGRNLPSPGDEYTYETSRRGFEPITYSGPLTELDVVRILLRRQGDFHLPLTVSFRRWRRAEMPELWDLDLPGVLKVRLNSAGLEIVSKPDHLRLGESEVYNLPVMMRNELDEEKDIKIIATIGDNGPTGRWIAAAKRVTYASLNLLPRSLEPDEARIRVFAGKDLPSEGSPPESRVSITARFPVEVVRWGQLRVKTRENGSPVGARVYVTGSDGLAYGPDGRDGEPTLSRITWTHGDYFYYSRGEHTIRMPEGEASIEAVRGIEYVPVKRTVNIRAGETTELTLDLKRNSDLAREHWYGGDLHTHVNYNDHEFMTPEDIQTQVLGEDLNYANLMVANSSGAQIHDEQYFEGRPHRLSDATHILYWGEEMRNGGVYGHMCLTGLKQLVKPLYTGFTDTSYPHDYPPNHVQALGAKRQGGVASYAHPGYEFTSDPQTMSARELPVDLALGSVDAMDVMSNSNEDGSTPYWYRLLNTGLRCAISAGSDSFTNRRHHWIPGGHRVYVYTGDSLNADDWVENFRKGRSFATNGPILRFTVNGKLAGTTLDLRSGDRIKVEASATSFVSMNRLEIVVNGEVVATERAGGDGKSVSLTKEIPVTEGSWVAARVRGDFHRLLVNDTDLYAHTSPVYLTVDGKSVSRKEDGQFFVEWVDQLIARIQKRGRYASDAQRQEVVALFKKGRAYYEKVAAEGR
jgi:hypothetical protein